MTTKGISPHAIRVLKKILSFLAIFTVLVIMLNGWYAFLSGVSILRLVNTGEPALTRTNLAEQVQVAGALILSIFTFLIFIRVNNDVNNEIIKQAGKRSKRREGEKDVFTEK